MNTYQNNLRRLSELEARIPNFLKEKEFAFVDLRPLIVTEKDIEENEISAEEIAELVAEGARELAKIEKRATKLGY